MPPNKLINEKSPYLLQHAHNPVDWHAWSDETFELARRQNKPVFLSIGYATCHWCHVMEKESFEDEAAARHLNDTFISIKVDREERPDIDAVYMAVCQMLTGSGGWPLNLFLTPDKKPFFAATYIPKNSRHGQAGLVELCEQVKKLWTTEADKVHSSAASIAVAPLQDVLGLGSEARFNTPGVAGGNWAWRFAWEQLEPGLARRLRRLTELSRRPPPAVPPA